MFAGAEAPLAEALDLPALVSAGADRDILRGYPAVLDGSGTMHPTKSICRDPAESPPDCVAVRWQELPQSTVFLSNASDLCPVLVAPLEEGVLRFKIVADTGTWTSEDEVVLHVRAAPSRVSPRVRAVADRYLAYREAAAPDAQDIRGTLGAGVTARWEPISAQHRDAAPMPAAVFKLIGEQDGLASAPDHLVLYPFHADTTGHNAPNANLEGPSLVAPGEVFSLDATSSTDVNDDALRWRWVETQGDAILPPGTAGAWVALSAPHRPQAIAVSVYVHDGVLESAPAELNVIVGQGLSEPALYPTPDLRTRPGRQVVLDALGGIPVAVGAGARSYTWQQTVGAPALWSAYNSGQGILVIAPDALGQLAFAVTAAEDGVESAPAVIVVNVVGAQENTAPEVLLSAPRAVVAYTQADVLGTLSEPEGDRITSTHWRIEGYDAGGQPVGVSMTLISDYDADSGAQPYIRVDAPAPGATVEVELIACDEFALCAAANLEILSL